MKRRTFLESAAASTVAAIAGLRGAEGAPGWRTFEVTTRLDILGASGPTRAWVPLPLMADTSWQKRLGDTWQGNAPEPRVWRDPRYDAGLVYAEWPAAVKDPALEVTSRFSTVARSADLLGPASGAAADQGSLSKFLEPTRLIPTDGIVGKTAREITQGKTADRDKARAIYEWIVENTFRDPKVRGCGTGDIRTMLETQYLGGK